VADPGKQVAAVGWHSDSQAGSGSNCDLQQMDSSVEMASTARRGGSAGSAILAEPPRTVMCLRQALIRSRAARAATPRCSPAARFHPNGLMRLDGIRARARRRYKCTTMSDHDQPVAANLLARNFAAVRPNQTWVGDATELYVPNGKLYLVSILDLYSRMVVGWAIGAVNDRHLAMRALDNAIKRRCPEAGLLHHTDQGSPYASEDYQRVLAAHGIKCSMSRRGNCHDNAAMESWHSTLKAELGERFESHAEAKQKLFDYVS